MEMVEEGEGPIYDYLKRSDREQAYQFSIGNSDCDGVNNVSEHQIGRAVDIYFIGEDGKLAPPKKGYDYWHERWEEKGGQPLIILSNGGKDNAHFGGGR